MEKDIRFVIVTFNPFYGPRLPVLYEIEASFDAAICQLFDDTGLTELLEEHNETVVNSLVDTKIRKFDRIQKKLIPIVHIMSFVIARCFWSYQSWQKKLKPFFKK